eukprot:Hpha_TRINITY_DN16496_c0_g10::TRINITY_DN16496_c0_g10_i1::g.162781::m.162781
MGCGAHSKQRQREINSSKVTESGEDGSEEQNPNQPTDKDAGGEAEHNDAVDDKGPKQGAEEAAREPSPKQRQEGGQEGQPAEEDKGGVDRPKPVTPKQGIRPSSAKETPGDSMKAEPRTEPRTQQSPADSRENSEGLRPSSTHRVRDRADHGDQGHGPLESPAPQSGQSPRGGFEGRGSQHFTSERRQTATDSTRSRTELMTNHSVAASDFEQPPLMTSSEIRKICNWVDDVGAASHQALPLPDVWGEISEKAIAILEEVEREKRARAAEREAERERRKRAAEMERASSVAQQTERSSLMADATELSQMGMTPSHSVNQSFREGEN